MHLLHSSFVLDNNVDHIKYPSMEVGSFCRISITKILMTDIYSTSKFNYIPDLSGTCSYNIQILVSLKISDKHGCHGRATFSVIQRSPRWCGRRAEQMCEIIGATLFYRFDLVGSEHFFTPFSSNHPHLLRRNEDERRYK